MWRVQPTVQPRGAPPPAGTVTRVLAPEGSATRSWSPGRASAGTLTSTASVSQGLGVWLTYRVGEPSREFASREEEARAAVFSARSHLLTPHPTHSPTYLSYTRPDLVFRTREGHLLGQALAWPVPPGALRARHARRARFVVSSLAPLRHRPTIRAPHELLCGARRHRRRLHLPLLPRPCPACERASAGCREC